MIIDSIPIALSFVALLISFIALWKTSFSKFSPVFTAGDLVFRIYPIRNGERRWFIPSIDLPISIANAGARPGRILDVRLVVKFPKLPIKDHYELFRPHWEIDTVKFRKTDKRERFLWLNEAVLGNWMPFIVLPKETVTKHLIFETRWDKPVIQEKVLFTVDILTDSSKEWNNIGEWEFSLSETYWSELAENGTSFVVSRAENYDTTEVNIFPEDLHKYTGTEKPITKKGFKPHSSYVDYSKKK